MIILTYIILLLMITTKSYATNVDIVDIEKMLQSKSTEYFSKTNKSNNFKENDIFLLFKKFLQGVNNQNDVIALNDRGFSVNKYNYNKASYWVISESKNYKNGHGMFVIKDKIDLENNTKIPVLIQAPHRYHDLYTGKILLNLLNTNQIDAAVWNSVNRKYADLARLPNSCYNSFTHAFVNVFPNAKIIQLHGFSEKNHPDLLNKNIAILLSSGRKKKTQFAINTKQCLQKIGFVKDEIAIYPNIGKNLGGRKNITGKILRKYRNNNFLHVEMNLPLRKILQKHNNYITKLVTCFTK